VPAGQCGRCRAERQPLVLHWNGTAWSVVPSPSGGPTSQLNGVSTQLGGTSVVAVGYSGSNYATEPISLVNQ
jgi:hypothetical protein